MTQGQWLIVQCTSGKEQASCDLLRDEGYAETFYPFDRVETRAWKRWKQRPSKRRAKKPARYRNAPVVKGYVFVDIGSGDRLALVDTTRRISARTDKVTARVVAPGNVPYVVTDADMLRMRHAPQRLQDLVDEVTRLENEAILAKRPKAGDTAKVLEGALAGQEVLIDGVEGEWAMFTAFGGTVKAPIGAVEKIT